MQSVSPVLDVEPGPREKWVVAAEGKGLDFVLEISVSGDRRKDLEHNVARYAALGIPEYFILDLRQHRIVGYRLEDPRSGYVPILPQAGRWESEVLGLELVLENGRVRFYAGSAPSLEADELIARLSSMVDELVRNTDELGRVLEDERKQRAAAEERVAQLEKRLRDNGIDPDEKGPPASTHQASLWTSQSGESGL